MVARRGRSVSARGSRIAAVRSFPMGTKGIIRGGEASGGTIRLCAGLGHRWTTHWKKNHFIQQNSRLREAKKCSVDRTKQLSQRIRKPSIGRSVSSIKSSISRLHWEKNSIVKFYIFLSVIKYSARKDHLYFILETIHTNDNSNYNYNRVKLSNYNHNRSNNIY